MRPDSKLTTQNIALRCLHASNAVSKDAVTLARHFFEAFTIENGDAATADFDKTSTLKESSSHCNACPPRPQKSRNHVVCKRKIVTANSIPRNQQPTAQPFL